MAALNPFYVIRYDIIIGVSVLWLVVFCLRELHVCTVCIWRCEHARFLCRFFKFYFCMHYIARKVFVYILIIIFMHYIEKKFHLFFH